MSRLIAARSTAWFVHTLCGIAVASGNKWRDTEAGAQDFGMMTLNCTRKFAQRVPFPIVESARPSTNRLGAWCANSFNISRSPMILITNEKTLISVIIPFKEVRSFHTRFLESLEVLFHSIALSSKDIQQELEEMKVVQFTTNTNRKTLGSMNDFDRHIRAMLNYDKNPTLEDISFHLSEIPCSPLRYAKPREAVYEIIDPPHRTQFGDRLN